MSEEKNHIDPEFNLDGFKEEDLFKVPDGYFDKLEDEILSKTVELNAEVSSTKVIPLFSKQVRLSIAAAILLLMSVGIVWTNFYSSPAESIDVEAMISEISSEDLVAFLDESDITTDELLAQLDLNEVNLIEEGEGFGLIEDDELDEILEELEEFEIEEILSDI